MPDHKPGISLIEQMGADASADHRMAAAMFAALGDKTELSASGHSIIFMPEHRLGRADLSGDPDVARRQIEHAGIDPDAVTDEQVQAYTAWFDEMYEARRVADARIVITAKFNEPYSGGQGSCGMFNRVDLIDGWGNDVDSARIECLSEWDPVAPNQFGQPGAFCSHPDYARINEAIASMREKHPELAGAPVQDKNAKEPAYMKSVKLKTICSNNNAHTTLAHPQSPLGNNHDASVQVRQINDVPEHVTTHELIRLFEHTVDMSWLGRPCGRCEINFAELGPGKILRYEIPEAHAQDNNVNSEMTTATPSKAKPKMGM